MAITQANLETALNVTFTGTPDLATFALNDVVYLLAEYTQTSGQNADFKYNPHKVVTISLKFVGTAVEDLNGAAADGSGTSVQKMWFYDIKNVATTVIARDQHQSLLNTLAQIKTLVGTEVSDWTDPA